jgi:serine/threonine-protein kinase
MQPRARSPGRDADAERARKLFPPGLTAAIAESCTPAERLGAGGSCEVWRALDSQGRSVALKIPSADRVRSAASLADLEREHEMLDRLRHPYVVGTLGLGRSRGAPALVLEYVSGGDLVSLAGAHPRHWIRAACDLCRALEHVRARGFAHRDVKARNVLLDASGRARLIDFASARPLGASASRAGTTAAHRLGSAGVVRESDDAGALAVLLYELLAGRLPFGRAGLSPTADEAAGPSWPLPAGADGAAVALAERCMAAIDPRSRLEPRLSAFADVLESAAMAYRRAA